MTAAAFAAVIFASIALGWALTSVTALLIGCAMAICTTFASIAAFANFIFATATIATSTTITVIAASIVMVMGVSTKAEAEYPSDNYA